MVYVEFFIENLFYSSKVYQLLHITIFKNERFRLKNNEYCFIRC